MLLFEIKGLKSFPQLYTGTIPAKPATDDPYEVASANFDHSAVLGDRTVPLRSLHGGVDLRDPAQLARVEKLTKSISSPGGYISRLIVSDDGAVIEGQHRLEALRRLGVEHVPVTVILDLAANIDVPALRQLIQQAQPMRSDHLTQIVTIVLEALYEAGSLAAMQDDYEAPAGFEKAWNAAIKYLAKRGTEIAS